jgi:hypothetical protein
VIGKGLSVRTISTDTLLTIVKLKSPTTDLVEVFQAVEKCCHVASSSHDIAGIRIHLDLNSKHHFWCLGRCIVLRNPKSIPHFDIFPYMAIIYPIPAPVLLCVSLYLLFFFTDSYTFSSVPLSCRHHPPLQKSLSKQSCRSRSARIHKILLRQVRDPKLPSWKWIRIRFITMNIWIYGTRTGTIFNRLLSGRTQTVRKNNAGTNISDSKI